MYGNAEKWALGFRKTAFKIRLAKALCSKAKSYYQNQHVLHAANLRNNLRLRKVNY